MPVEKSEVCNNGLCYAAQSLYLCKGSVFTPLATSSEATWSDKESLWRKGRQNASDLTNSKYQIGYGTTK